MICPSCLSEVPTQPTCSECGAPGLVGERYSLQERVGLGAKGAVYRAVPEDSGGEVAVKVLPLPLGMDAKEHVLAQREAEVLRQLDHPAIPSFHGL